MQSITYFSKNLLNILRRGTWKILCLLFLLTAFWGAIQNYHGQDRIYLSTEGLRDIVVSSGGYQYFEYHVPSSVITEKDLYYKAGSPVRDLSPADTSIFTFTFNYEDQQQLVLHYSLALNMVLRVNNQPVKPSLALKEVLLDFVAMYSQEAAKNYGALLVWDDVDMLFPMYATARVIDIYSGASFSVQRREGSSHVDAQPLTAQDTAVMKKIFNGRWSWERRGIIVEVGGQRIAASMNGMPHGAGKIDDNNFPGHFCIHFLGSTIHAGGMDIQHHREIFKAAGKLPLEEPQESTGADTNSDVSLCWP